MLVTHLARTRETTHAKIKSVPTTPSSEHSRTVGTFGITVVCERPTMARLLTPSDISESNFEGGSPNVESTVSN